MTGEGGLAFEPGDSGGFADELGSSQFPASRHGQQCRGDSAHPRTDPLGQCVDRFGQPGDVSELIAGQLGDQTGQGRQPGAQQFTVFGAIQRGRDGGTLGIEFMNPPTQPVDRRSPLRHKDFPPIHQQLEFTGHLVMGSDRQVRFPQESPRNGQRVDRVGLAPSARRSPGLGHQLRRHPHHLLTETEQVAFQPRRQMPTILDRPHHLVSEAFPRPHHRLGMTCGDGLDGLLAELAPHLVDSDEGMRALVHIGSNNNHGGCLHSL